MDKLISQDIYQEIRIKWLETIGSVIAIGQESVEIIKEIFKFQDNRIFINTDKIEALNEVLIKVVNVTPDIVTGFYDTLTSLLFPDKRPYNFKD